MMFYALGLINEKGSSYLCHPDFVFGSLSIRVGMNRIGQKGIVEQSSLHAQIAAPTPTPLLLLGLNSQACKCY